MFSIGKMLKKRRHGRLSYSSSSEGRNTEERTVENTEANKRYEIRKKECSECRGRLHAAAHSFSVEESLLNVVSEQRGGQCVVMRVVSVPGARCLGSTESSRSAGTRGVSVASYGACAQNLENSLFFRGWVAISRHMSLW